MNPVYTTILDNNPYLPAVEADGNAPLFPIVACYKARSNGELLHVRFSRDGSFLLVNNRNYTASVIGQRIEARYSKIQLIAETIFYLGSALFYGYRIGEDEREADQYKAGAVLSVCALACLLWEYVQRETLIVEAQRQINMITAIYRHFYGYSLGDLPSRQWPYMDFERTIPLVELEAAVIMEPDAPV